MIRGKWIRYTKSQSEDEGTQALKFGTHEIETTYTRVYHNALQLALGLSPCARHLLDYLSSVMDKENTVQSTRGRRVSFINVMEGFGVTYEDSTVGKAFLELAQLRLILRLSRGSYQVNPEYYMKNAAKGREKMIRYNLERDGK